MSILQFELNKVLSRRFTLILLIATCILFPSIIKVIAHLNVIKDNVPEGLFVNNISFAIIFYAQSYFFIPVWIIAIVGNELTNGHVNRVTFIKSRDFYFSSKLLFTLSLSLLFAILGVLSLIFSVTTSPFKYLQVEFSYYLVFFIQLLFSCLYFSILLLCITFILKSPIKVFITYFLMTFLEGIIFSIFESIYKIELKWLPFHLVKTIYLRNGDSKLSNYYNPFLEDFNSLVLPTIFVVAITFITYKIFIKSNFATLSD
ncbi:MAG: hypothetical protein O9302_03290 [Cyclobacteriaceae bacterium]|jgi:lysylphosphatidylglycerol synthetase-like protein (DUF2156 family)|nr:hypothetical protein [Cytophagales bacterium]MCZ8327061.1 hypothetical protein [Cyclobacteriaceae bacterium]